MNTQQAVLASIIDSPHVPLNEGSRDKKHLLNNMELPMCREQTARKRKHLSKEKLDNEKAHSPCYVTTKVPSHCQKTINLTHATQTKQINLQYHVIREAVEEEEIIIKYAPMAKNMSDIFTKALQKPKYKFFVEKLGLAPVVEEGKDKMSR